MGEVSGRGRGYWVSRDKERKWAEMGAEVGGALRGGMIWSSGWGERKWAGRWAEVGGDWKVCVGGVILREWAGWLSGSRRGMGRKWAL